MSRQLESYRGGPCPSFLTWTLFRCQSAQEIVRYLAFFKGEEAQDNYPVYDNIVKGALPKYIAYFGLNRRSQAALSDYRAYRECVAEIIAHAEEPISRNGFDHLVWHYFKGRQ